MSIVFQMRQLGAHISCSPILLSWFKISFETHILELSSEYVHELHKKTGHIIMLSSLLV